MAKPRILMVDDEPSVLFMYARYLGKAGYETTEAGSLEEARRLVAQERYDAVLLDMFLPDGNGLDWIEVLREAIPEIAIVVITGAGDVPMAVKAMKLGADNFLTKPVDLAGLDVYLKKSLELGTLRRNNMVQKMLHRKPEPSYGSSPKVRETWKLAELAAKSESPVLLTGETGVGKGIMARWIHEHSNVSANPFVEVNCSSLRGELLASELFGHVKGAFTSAINDRQGLIEVADGGTLFLDEIADMDIGVQAQFLKVVEEKTYRRVGEVTQRKSSFRLLCATNRNLQAEVEAGRFRRDLFYRINVLNIQIPPLRERIDDLAELSSHILGSLGMEDTELSTPVLRALSVYDWPGNVRELKNVLERAMILSRCAPLELHHLVGFGPQGAESNMLGGAQSHAAPCEPVSLEHAEALHISRVLEESGGEIVDAARKLGLSRSTLYRKIKKFREDGIIS